MNNKAFRGEILHRGQMSLGSTFLLLSILFTPVFARAQTTGGVVEGQVRTATGGGVSGLRVALVEAGVSGTGRNESQVMVGLTQTDGSGNYRLADIPPGRYYIMAGLIDFPTYFPGALRRDDAAVITVADRSLQSGMDFVLQSVFTVSGHVRYALDERAGTEVTLQSNPRIPIPMLRAAMGPDGAFQFAAVPAGNYVARAGAIRMPLVVDGDVSDLELKTPPSVEVTVRFKTDNDGPVPKTSLRFNDFADAYPAKSASDGASTTLPAVKYRVTTSDLPAGYSLKSMTHDSVEFLSSVDLSKYDNSEIVVTLISPTPAVEVRGHVAAAAGMITPTKVRISSPAAAAESTLDAKGEFNLSNVLRGNYITYVLGELGEPSNRGTRSDRSVYIGTRSIDVMENVQNVKLALPALIVVVAGGGTTPAPTWIAEGKIRATNEDGKPFSSFVPPSILYGTPLGAAGGSRNAGTATLDGEFRIELPKGAEGEWILELGLPPEGYYVRTVSAGPLDLIREPLRLTPSDKPQDLDIHIEFARIPAP
jgi:hypothetical protein